MHADRVLEDRDADRHRDQRLQVIVLFLRFRQRGRDHRIEARHDQDLVLAAAEARDAVADVAVELLGLLERARRGEDQFGNPRGDIAAGARGAGLHQHRPALRRAGDVQRPAHLEVLPLVVQHMHLRGVEGDAGFLVADEGILVPAVPQTADHLGELDGAVIAVGVAEMLVARIVQRILLVVRGHEVPARAAAADLVERGELAGQRIGLVEGRGRGGDQAEILRDRCKSRQDGHRLELHDLAHAAAHIVAALEIDRRGIGQEQQVELAPFGELGVLHHLGKAGAGLHVSLGMTPGRDMLAGLVHEGPETHHPLLLRLRHVSLPIFKRWDCKKRGKRYAIAYRARLRLAQSVRWAKVAPMILHGNMG